MAQKQEQAGVVVSSIKPDDPTIQRRVTDLFVLAYAEAINNGKKLPFGADPVAFINSKTEKTSIDSNYVMKQAQDFTAGVTTILKIGLTSQRFNTASAEYPHVADNKAIVDKVVAKLTRELSLPPRGKEVTVDEAVVKPEQLPIVITTAPVMEGGAQAKGSDGKPLFQININWPSYITQVQKTEFSSQDARTKPKG